MILNLRKVLSFGTVILLAAALAACTLASPPQEVSAPPQPTAGEDLTPDADTPAGPAATEPAHTPQQQPGLSPEEQILIAAPGMNSQVTSPFVLEGIAVAPFEGLLGVQLTDISGVVLAEAYPQVQAQMGQKGPFRQEITFSGIEEETPARLMVYSSSPKDGGLVHASSVVVRLLPSGETQINLPEDPQEDIEITSPASGATVSGGELTVRGTSNYYFESNLSVVLCAEGGSSGPHLICGDIGSVLAEGYAMIDSPEIGIGGPFEGVLQYSVAAETSARLVVYAVSPMDGGIEHLSSIAITLVP